jgi:hypothetical protein
MNDLAAAREWTNEHCEQLVRRANSDDGSRGPVYAALKNALEIRRTTNEQGYPIGYTVSEETATYLYARAFECPDTYDIAVQVTSRNIDEGIPLPRMLQAFACLVITGRLRRPTRRGRDRTENWKRDCAILEMLMTLAVDFRISPSRNEETTQMDSACDLVMQGLSRAGMHLTYSTVRSIWNNHRLRGELRTIHALIGSGAQGTPGFISRCEPPFDVPKK